MDVASEPTRGKSGKNGRKNKSLTEKERNTSRKPGIPVWKMNLIYESELSRTKRLFRKKIYNASVKLKNLQKTQQHLQTSTSNTTQVLPNVAAENPISIVVKNVFTKKENVTEEMVSPDELEIPEDPLDTTYQMTSPVMIDFENDDEL